MSVLQTLISTPPTCPANIAPLKPTDTLIIGAGPTGLFTAFYCGLRGLSTALLDSLPAVGGQLATLYPEKSIYDIPGFPAVSARELVTRLQAQADYYHPTYHLGHEVRDLLPGPDPHTLLVRTSTAELATRTVVIAAGVGAFRPRHLPVESAERFEGHGLAYSLDPLDRYRDQRVVIVGGGDQAVTWANRLAEVAAAVTLVHRRDTFRADAKDVTQLTSGPVRIMRGYEIRRLHGDDRLTHATLHNINSNFEDTVATDALLVSLGYESSLGAIANWGLALQGGQIVVDHTMMTSRPGVFAAGDVCTYPGKLKLLASAFAEAATAANHAKKYIDPGAPVFPGHSTNLRREQ